jgi:hypothetical protein
MRTILTSTVAAFALGFAGLPAVSAEPTPERSAYDALIGAGADVNSTVRRSPVPGLSVYFGCKAKIECADFAALAAVKSLANLECIVSPSDEQIGALRGHEGLRRIMLNSERLTDAGLEHLGTLPNLEEFLLRRSAYTAEGLVKLAPRLGNVRSLHFSQRGVTDEGLAALKSLPGLSRLSIGACEVTDRGVQHLRGLKDLEELMLYQVALTDDGLAILKDLPKLKKLYIGAPGVTDRGIVHFKALTGLESLMLYGSKVTTAGVLELKRAMPGTTVRR